MEGAQSVAVGAYPGGCSHGSRQEVEREQAGNTNEYFVCSRTHTSDQLPPSRTHFLEAPRPSNSAICTTFYNVGRCYAGHWGRKDDDGLPQSWILHATALNWQVRCVYPVLVA